MARAASIDVIEHHPVIDNIAQPAPSPTQNGSAAESVPPRDGGRAAWMLLAAVSCILMISWGMS